MPSACTSKRCCGSPAFVKWIDLPSGERSRSSATSRVPSGIETAARASFVPAASSGAWKIVVRAFRSMVRATDVGGIAGSFAALRDMDLRRTDALLPWPTLVIAGRDDTVTLPEHGKLIAETVPGAKLVVLPAVHLPNVECTDLFLDRVLAFLSQSVGGPVVRLARQRDAAPRS